ncbi:MAG: hypothetical protein ABI551_23210, partial [Polyangiaceae bacterium]
MSAIATFRGGVSSDLAEWLERQLAEGVTRVALRHKSEDGGETLVREFSMNDGGNIPALADLLNRRAHDDGRHFRGRSVYGVFAFNENDYVDRFFIAVEGAEDMAHFGSREANLSGV